MDIATAVRLAGLVPAGHDPLSAYSGLKEGLRRNLHMQGRLKRRLCPDLPLQDVAALMTLLLDYGFEPRPTLCALVGMRDFVRESGLCYAEIPTPQSFCIKRPRIFGAGRKPDITATGRSVFVGAVANAMVRFRSSLVKVGRQLLIDTQNDEAQAFRIMMHADPMVLDIQGTEVIADEHVEAPAFRLAEAVRLGGVPSYAFGHWLAQFLPKLWAARASRLLPRIPILVDAGMPESHYEALRSVLADDTEVVAVPAGADVQVAKLWLLGDWSYVPLLPEGGQDLGAERLSAPPLEFAAVMRDMASILPDRQSSDARLFLARKPHLHRKMRNQSRLAKLAAESGYIERYLEDHSFLDQLRLVRSARSVVGPDGSNLMMCMFARPGSLITILTHGFEENLPSFTAILESLELNVQVVQADCIEEHPTYRRFSDYEIDEAAFQLAINRIH